MGQLERLIDVDNLPTYHFGTMSGTMLLTDLFEDRESAEKAKILRIEQEKTAEYPLMGVENAKRTRARNIEIIKNARVREVEVGEFYSEPNAKFVRHGVNDGITHS